MSNKDWKYCPICGNPIAECECGELFAQIPKTYATIDYSDMDCAEAEDGAQFDDIMYNRYLER